MTLLPSQQRLIDAARTFAEAGAVVDRSTWSIERKRDFASACTITALADRNDELEAELAKLRGELQ